MAPVPQPAIISIHEHFLALSRIGEDHFGGLLGSRLLLRSALDAEGIAVVVAASVAGAASLVVDGQGARLREGLRSGFIDFVVSNLDEALRILKNEIRQARPVAVGLTGEAEPSIDAMIERGLQPDLLSAVAQPQSRPFEERGAIRLRGETESERGTALVTWSVADDPARGMRRIAEVAAAALDPVRDDTVARRRWLERSPRYLGRTYAAHQCLRMTDAESARFLSGVHAENPGAQFTRDGRPV